MNPLKTQTQEELLLEMYEKVTQIHTALYGVPGTAEKGMCGRVTAVENDNKKFRAMFFILLGSGALVGSGIGIDKLISVLSGG